MQKRDNIEKAIEHFKSMDKRDFYFSQWMACPERTLREWWGKPNPPCVHDCFVLTGEVPCGTVACFAGEVQLQFAETKEQRSMLPAEFTIWFLGEDRNGCVISRSRFLGGYIYGVDDSSQVKPQHIAKYLKEALRAGSWWP